MIKNNDNEMFKIDDLRNTDHFPKIAEYIDRNLSSLHRLPVIKKIVRYSDPDPNKETIFIWPEGIFAGVYLEDLKKFSHVFDKNSPHGSLGAFRGYQRK